MKAFLGYRKGRFATAHRAPLRADNDTSLCESNGYLMVTRRDFLTTVAGAMVCGLGLSSYAFAIEAGFRLAVRRWAVAPVQWPPSAPLLRIAMLTDIHAGEPWMTARRIARVANAAMELRPDLIVLLGDYVTSMHRRYRGAIVPIREWAGALGALHAPLGVYSVLGNHDWWDDVEGIRTGLSGVGIPVMENDAIKITGGGHSFWLAGLGDQLAHGRRVRGRPRGVDDLVGTIAQVADDDPLILMAHEPDIFIRSSPRVALQLSGHTHGGQVSFPLIGPPVVPSAYGQRYAYGHIIENGRHLVVSAGLGVSGLPIRLFVPPEITLVDVHPPMKA
jgi:predicted MPP superfamily phosphohydrolase